ncbi:hypothetical protein CC78DRAFT_577160 [Lojkania enalia]|uniref:Uncharacterized protein n=1 Tax=Lojkania enalia TaxID=147567 RepID=A0A9P4N7V5_9PLEO|nr:hypothetical protein CC78DRAFT_577160 [Didymosphaeria enalia]
MAPTLQTRKIPLKPSLTIQHRTKGKGKTDLLVKPRKAIPRKTGSKRKSPAVDPISPSTWREPANPQATFMGLPTELRLHIYSYISNATLMHVYRHKEGQWINGNWRPPRFFWSPCQAPHPDYPMLCLNPKWSGLCEESERCAYRIYSPPESSGFVALSQTCKLIHSETQEFFRRGTSVCIHPQEVRPWLDHLESIAPEQIECLQSVTFFGMRPDRSWYDVAIKELKSRVPNLTTVGCQGQVRKWSMLNGRHVFDAELWRNWYLAQCVKTLDANITVVMEGYIFNKRRVNYAHSPDKDEQLVVRVVREGKNGKYNGDSWTNGNVETELRRSELISPKRTAKWRQWWRGKDLVGFF